MILICGTNQFKDHRFSFHDWSAPVLQTPQELMDALHSLHLEGRTIKHIHATAATIFNWERGRVSEFLNPAFHALSYEEQSTLQDFSPYLDPYARKHRGLQYNGPILIEFEDHDILGVQFEAGSCVRISMNTLPLDLRPSFLTSQPDTDLLFSPILGQQIESVDIVATSDWPGFSEPYRLTLDEQPFYIKQFSFICHSANSNRQRLQLEWQYFDFEDDGYMELSGDPNLSLDAQQVLEVARHCVTAQDLADESQFWKDEKKYWESQQGEENDS